MATDLKLQTPPGGPIPPFAHHAITVYLPYWSNLLRFMEKEPEFLGSLKSMYPRMMLHRDVKSLVAVVLERFGKEGQNVLLFSAAESASECKKFVTSPARGDNVMSPDDITIKVLDINVRLWAVFFPMPKTPFVMPYWMNAGVGISSRLAEESLKHLRLLHEVTSDDPEPTANISPADGVLRERIAALLERAPAGPPRHEKVKAKDVYLFQTGMSSIYTVHQYLLSKYNTKTVLFGFAFHSTPHVFEDFGPGYKFFGLGTAPELIELETYLKTEKAEGRSIQAVWTEFPANPILTTPDLGRLRELADEYGCLLVVDDTVGSFCNVDVLGAADIVVTSLTKSFSGYADVMGASAVLNPSSSRYKELKALFEEKYVNRFWGGDAEQLEENSRNYLERSAQLNKNAETLVNYLQAQISNPESSVAKVYYPTTNPTLPNYRAWMRKETESFKPGYGCLFTLEFETVEAIQAFYDNLHVHSGPHLGAHLTLSIPYVKGLYGKQLDWAEKYDLRETQIRISVGLEDTKELLEVFKVALEFADHTEVKSEVVAIT